MLFKEDKSPNTFNSQMTTATRTTILTTLLILPSIGM